jgi:DNA-binding XRE family transcriptional regulator
MDTARIVRTGDGEDVVQLSRAAYDALLDERDMLASQLAASRVADGLETPVAAEDIETYFAAPSPLVFWRAKRGMSPADLADRAGITVDLLRSAESGDTPIDLATAARLARVLGIGIDDLAPL